MTGHITWLTGSPDIPKTLSVEEKINSWFDKASKILRLNPAQTSYEIINKESDPSGEEHYKVQQYHNGIKVYNAEMIVHLKEGNIHQSNGHYTQSNLLPQPSSKAVRLVEDIKSTIKKEVDHFQEDHLSELKDLGISIESKQWQNELVYYKHNDDYRLTYYVQVYPHLADQLVYFVDAYSGEVLKKYSNICRSHHHSCSGHDHEHVSSHKKPVGSITEYRLALDGQAEADAQDLLGRIRRINTYEVSGTYFMIDASRSMHNSALSSFPNDGVGVILDDRYE